MIVRPTEDVGLIRRCMTHPAVWKHVSDDGSPPVDKFWPPIGEPVLYLAAFEGEDCGGVWVYHPHNLILFEVHTCCLPEWWGPRALEAARRTLLWMIGNTPCRKVITHVPAPNRRAYSFALRVGLQDEGLNRASFQKNGMLFDQYVLGITEGEISCLPLQ
jgi:RimJ/RimL family protein N-acetyltransferase